MTTTAKKLLGLLIAPAFLLSFTYHPDRSDFTGEWKLNQSKSELGQLEPYAPRVIKVTQSADSITISKTAPGFTGEDVTLQETLSYDGKEIESTVYGTSKRKASATWSDDGKTLTIKYNLNLDFNGQTLEINGTEAWTLGDDGKTLVSQNNSTSSYGEIQAKGIYEK